MPASVHTFHHEAMATAFAIRIANQAAAYARQAAAAAWRELDRLEQELSRFIESSDIARVNRLARGEATTIGEDAMQCLVRAAEISAATHRAFDPAYASVRAPEQAADAALFALDPAAHTVTSLTSRLHLDLGAIGKGYALDVMARVLDEWATTAALLEAGGSTVLALAAPEGLAGWEVAVGEAAHRHAFPLVHRALSGSGIAVKGEHLINPRTGVAATRAQRTWSLAVDGTTADALSTAFFAMTDPEVAAFFRQGDTARTEAAALPRVGAILTQSDGSLASYGDVPVRRS